MDKMKLFKVSYADGNERLFEAPGVYEIIKYLADMEPAENVDNIIKIELKPLTKIKG